MSAAIGHVTRKEGRIVELPERVGKVFKYLNIVPLVLPGLMLLIALFTPQWTFAWYWAAILLLLPGLATVALVAILREGKWGITAFAAPLVLLQWTALTLEPHTAGHIEGLLTRLVPIAGILATVYFFKHDLHYHLRPLWYSLAAMQDFQKMMGDMQERKAARKEGRAYNPDNTIDAEAIVRSLQAKTGVDVPAHMQGFNVKPGFRQESKGHNKTSQTASKQKKRR